MIPLVSLQRRLDIGVQDANAKQFRLLRSAEDPENEDITAAFFSVVLLYQTLTRLQSIKLE